MKSKYKALFAVALFMSAAAQAVPVVVARPIAAPPVPAPHVTPVAHGTPATSLAAAPRINQASAEPRAVSAARLSAAERHAAHATPALPVINVPAPLRTRCKDDTKRECLK